MAGKMIQNGAKIFFFLVFLYWLGRAGLLECKVIKINFLPRKALHLSDCETVTTQTLPVPASLCSCGGWGHDMIKSCSLLSLLGLLVTLAGSLPVHTFSYLDDIADLEKIRGNQPLRRDEEVSDTSSDVTPSSVVNMTGLLNSYNDGQSQPSHH